MKKLNRNVVILGFVSFFNDVSSEMIVKVLPLFLESIGAGGAFIGVIEGVAESTASLLKLFFGYFSDRFKNRKWFAFFGYFESTITKCFLPIARSPVAVLWIRALERVGKGIRTAPRDALISSYTNETNRGLYFGFHRALDTLGAAVGPLLGIWVLKVFGETNYEAVFKCALIPAFIAVGLILFVKEREFKRFVDKQKAASHFNLGKRFYFYIAAVTLFTIGNSSDAFITMYSGKIGLVASSILFLWFIHSAVYGLLATPLGALSDKIGRKKTIILGYSIYALSYIGFALAHSPIALYLIYPLYGVYYAFSEGAQKAFVSDLVPDKSSLGTAYGIYSFGVGIMALPASIIAGMLYQYVAPSSPFYFGGAVALCSALLIMFV